VHNYTLTVFTNLQPSRPDSREQRGKSSSQKSEGRDGKAERQGQRAEQRIDSGEQRAMKRDGVSPILLHIERLDKTSQIRYERADTTINSSSHINHTRDSI
jgi:hypothetical protein